MLPAFSHELVTQNPWLTREEFIYAVALGQATPGPVILGMVFVGVKWAGWIGAIGVGIFLVVPGLLWTGLVGFVYQRWRELPLLHHVLKDLRLAIPGLLAALAWNLLAEKGLTRLDAAVIALTLWFVLRWRVNPAPIILSTIVISCLMK